MIEAINVRLLVRMKIRILDAGKEGMKRESAIAGQWARWVDSESHVVQAKIPRSVVRWKVSG